MISSLSILPPRANSTLLFLVITATLSLTSSFITTDPRNNQIANALVTARGLTVAMSADTAGSVASEARSLDLFGTTPLIHSRPLTDLCAGRHPVYLKLDNLQRSGSFKDRGVGHLCATIRKIKGSNCRLVSSSGGNAGLAVATVGGQELGMAVSVVVPESTKELVVRRLRDIGAEVTVHGKNWNEADTLARKMVKEDSNAEYISPYDNPLLWTGHSTVVDEIVDQLQSVDKNASIGAFIVSVGGGGLLCGVFEGIERSYFGSRSQTVGNSKVVACETDGAASFAAAHEAGKPVSLKGIDSVATSLGALEVTPASLVRAERHEERGGTVATAVCTDREAIDACLRLSADHRILVEPACGAALASLYSDRLREETLKGVEEGSAIVVEVCGGSGVNLDLLAMWKKQFLE